ncbi:hypothetical protein FSP39_003876 [Pinctada imbricata]|uniref:Uncharacterized protein n=1 Tax=Pinctada imbricata TaxID=66713 RepID=A0AA88YUD0_PINIB|nr:hypothetical protein FSP39_003876 [Pinctada imbricata]
MAEYDDKEKLAQLMKPEYMSSEESDMEDGEPIFRVRRLQWLKEKCNKAKDTLDKKYSDSLPTNLRKLKRKRVLSVEPSEGKPPQSAPGWMLSKTWCDNFNSHM